MTNSQKYITWFHTTNKPFQGAEEAAVLELACKIVNYMETRHIYGRLRNMTYSACAMVTNTACHLLNYSHRVNPLTVSSCTRLVT